MKICDLSEWETKRVDNILSITNHSWFSLDYINLLLKQEKMQAVEYEKKKKCMISRKENCVVLVEKKCILLRNDCVVVCSISLHITLVHTHKRTPKHNIRLLSCFERAKLTEKSDFF